MNKPDLQDIDATALAILARAGLSSAAAAGPLAMAAPAPEGGNWRVTWANEKALAFFGVGQAAEISRICLTGPEPGARQLHRLAERAEAGGSVLDLRLRLRLPAGMEMMTLSCRKLAGPEPIFLIAPWGHPADPYSPPAEPPATPAPPVSSEERNDAHTAVAAPPDSAGSGSPTASAGRLAAAPKVRFLWRTDREGRLTGITGSLCETVGCDSAGLIGRDFLAIAEELKLDPDGQLRRALGKQETWSGIEVLWPVRGENLRLPVSLGALPGFDRHRAFDGFSGFGVLHTDRAIAIQPAEANAGEAGSGVAERTGTGGTEVPYDATAADGEISAHATDTHLDVQDGAGDRTGGEKTEVAASPDTPTRSGKAAEDGRKDGATAHSGGPEGVNPAEDAAAAKAHTGEAADHRAPNVVQLRAWQKETRVTYSITEPPVFAKQDQPPSMPEAHARLPAEEKTNENAAEGANAASQDEAASQPVPAASEFPAIRDEDTRNQNVAHDELVKLSPAERNAFREIARALGSRAGMPQNDPAREDKRAVEKAEPGATAIASPADDGGAAASAPMPAIAEIAPAAEPIAAPAFEIENLNRLLEKIDSALLVSRGGVPAFANKVFLDLLGYGDIDAFHAAGGVERMFRGRSPDALTRDGNGEAIPVVAGNGEVLALEGRFQKIAWDGEPATLMTFRRAQTNEAQARVNALELEARQHEAEKRELHAVLDTATDGVLLLDAEGKILSLNRSGQALFGYDENEVAGEVFTALLARDSHAMALDYFNGLKSNGVKSVLNDGREVTGRVRQGGAIPMFMTLGRVGGTIPRFCAVLRDLTQWKKVERELGDARRDAERASALKSDFLAKISHEIRTPLNAIIGFAEVIMDERFGPVGNERYKDYLKDIHNSGTHVLSLVNDLLDLSKIEAGKLDLNFTSVDANRIVNECVSIIQAQATRERVIIRLSLSPRLPNIVADERALKQIVLNILSNAVKFNEPGGQVIVSTALTDAGHAVIRIRDTGIGMSDAELEMALEPFRQIATSRQTTGTGLGLPLTKALVEASRASFVIKSRKGEGTLVEVAFPPTRVLAE